MECVDSEASRAQNLDPVAVTGMKLHPAAGGLQAGYLPLRPQQLLPCGSGSLGPAQSDQDADGVEYQPPAWAQQPGCLGHPAGRITPQACPALGDSHIETAVAEGGVPQYLQLKVTTV